MDDVALITENHKYLQEMLNVTYDVANKYHIEFGMAKSKILKIGKTKENHGPIQNDGRAIWQSK